jgi:hypothetical protein
VFLHNFQTGVLKPALLALEAVLGRGGLAYLIAPDEFAGHERVHAGEIVGRTVRHRGLAEIATGDAETCAVADLSCLATIATTIAILGLPNGTVPSRVTRLPAEAADGLRELRAFVDVVSVCDGPCGCLLVAPPTGHDCVLILHV